MAPVDKRPNQNGAIKLVRTDGVAPESWWPGQSKIGTTWDDGAVSYILHTSSGRVHGVEIAEAADYAILFVDAIRGDGDLSAWDMRDVLDSVRRLRHQLEAIENEAILYARENSVQDASAAGEGKPRLTFAEIALQLKLDHSTVVERYHKMVSGRHSSFRQWLVQGTAREYAYNGVSYRL